MTLLVRTVMRSLSAVIPQSSCARNHLDPANTLPASRSFLGGLFFVGSSWKRTLAPTDQELRDLPPKEAGLPLHPLLALNGTFPRGVGTLPPPPTPPPLVVPSDAVCLLLEIFARRRGVVLVNRCPDHGRRTSTGGWGGVGGGGWEPYLAEVLVGRTTRGWPRLLPPHPGHEKQRVWVLLTTKRGGGGVLKQLWSPRPPGPRRGDRFWPFCFAQEGGYDALKDPPPFPEDNVSGGVGGGRQAHPPTSCFWAFARIASLVF